MFDNSFNQFSFGMAYLMLILDCILLLFLIYYLDAVLPYNNFSHRNPFFIFSVNFILYINFK